MLVYLLIDGRKFLPYKEQFRVFTDKAECVEEARKLGYGSGMIGECFALGDVPGFAVMEMCGDVNVTMIPLLMEDPK